MIQEPQPNATMVQFTADISRRRSSARREGEKGGQGRQTPTKKHGIDGKTKPVSFYNDMFRIPFSLCKMNLT